MRLCFIGKYPPIQGGVSRVNFWDAYALAAAGHEVHVVTNAPEVESAYRLREEFYRNQPGGDPRVGSDVVVHAPSGAPLRYIPYANPFVSKLAGIATQVAADARCDLIYAYYLEPYGVAAHLAAGWTGVPYGLRHAGSDVRRLARHEALRTTYDRLAKDAAFWLDTSVVLRRAWQSRGVPLERFYSIGRYSLPTGHFHPGAAPMRFAELGPFEPGAPTVGMYGKLGETKGSFDLLRAFARARADAGTGNLVVAAGGPAGELDRFRALAGELGVDVLILPFMPHWKVPSFIAACDAVAFLERGFSVDIHRPTVPREILACGRCLIMSAEVAAYQGYAHLIRDGENCLIVDPRDAAALARTVRTVLETPDAVRDIGLNGHRGISRQIEDWDDYTKRLSRTFERIVADLRDRSTLVSVAEMQAAFARLAVDEAYREWCRLAPDEALTKYELTAEEMTAIKSINAKLLGLFAESLRARRRRAVLDFYPLCIAVDEARTRRYFDRFYDLYPVPADTTTADLVVSFGRYLTDCLDADAAVVDYAADLCRYEATLAELGVRPLPDEDLLAPPVEAPAPGVGGPVTCGPATASGVRCLHLSYDVPALAEEIERGRTPPSATAQETYVVLRAVPRKSVPEAFKVDAATAALLALCTGEHTMAEIKERMAERLGRAGSLDAALPGAIDRLRAARLIHAH